jgi:hypothetical protein
MRTNGCSENNPNLNEPKRVAIGIITRKGKLSPAREKFCKCAKEAFAASC